MHTERFTIALSVLRPDAPQIDEKAAAELQDAHLSHLADLHEAGHLLAGGPLADEEFRGLSILGVVRGRAGALKAHDPAVVAGRFAMKIMPWTVLSGVITAS